VSYMTYGNPAIIHALYLIQKKRFMTWHAVDSQSTHERSIYPELQLLSAISLSEVPFAPDWAAS
jgi:hypothetical protein